MMMASDLGLQALTKFQSLAMIRVDDSVDWNGDVDVDDGSRYWSAGFSPESENDYYDGMVFLITLMMMMMMILMIMVVLIR